MANYVYTTELSLELSLNINSGRGIIIVKYLLLSFLKNNSYWSHTYYPRLHYEPVITVYSTSRVSDWK